MSFFFSPQYTIDECDIFLEQRALHDLHQNGKLRGAFGQGYVQVGVSVPRNRADVLAIISISDRVWDELLASPRRWRSLEFCKPT